MYHHHKLTMNSATKKAVNKSVKDSLLSYEAPKEELSDQYASLLKRYHHLSEALLCSLQAKKAQNKKKKSKRTGPHDWGMSKKTEATPHHEHIEGTHWNRFVTISIKAAQKTKKFFSQGQALSAKNTKIY